MSTTASVNDVAAITTSMRKALPAWWRTPVADRLRCVRRFRRLLVDECDRVAAAVQADLGKPPPETLACEILPLAAACRFLEKEAAGILRPRKVPASQRPLWLWGERDVVHHRPHGIVGIIGTWNYPVYLNGGEIAQALTAGNGVLWKPSEVAPRSADVLWDLVLKAGFPPGVLERLPATREAGRWLAEADVDHVVFTGHADTGRFLAATLGKRLVSSTLELSGCDAMVVMEDADLAMAAKAAWFGLTLNSGQTCLAVRRIFVAQGVHEAFLAALRPLAAQARPMRLALPAQAKLANELVHQALAEGAAVLCRDVHAAGESEFTPVVLTNVRPSMRICQDATFVPLACVIPFATEEEVLEAQASCGYALGASVFTREPARGERLAERWPVGMVAINDVIAPTGHPATPFGGRKASGWGVTQGLEGLIAMTVPQVVSRRSGSFRPHYEPPSEKGLTSPAKMKALLELSHAGSWRRRLAAAWRMIAG